MIPKCRVASVKKHAVEHFLGRLGKMADAWADAGADAGESL